MERIEKIKYFVEFYHEAHGNYNGYEVYSDDFEKVLKTAKSECGIADWFEIETKDRMLWNGAMTDEYNRKKL